MPVNLRYPSAVDYTLALQHPAAAFNDPELRGAVFARGFMGPEGIAGSSAVVFRAAIGGTDYALRCYTRQDASTPERYDALDDYVTVARLSRYVGAVTWFDDEVLVKGHRWPVLTMEWIAGQHLNEYVGNLADEGNVAGLRMLANRWLALIVDLQQARFAHGDLQHGNILVDADRKLRLVDFDSVWLPPLQGQRPPTETGHPSYQPQSVTAAGRWGPLMDTFPGLVIYLALTALAKAPGLWGKLNNGDNLLFERRDFVPPHDTEVWTLLAGLRDPEIDRLAMKLMEFCAPGWTASTTLLQAVRPQPPRGEGLLPEPGRPPASRPEPGRPKPNWWELAESARPRPAGGPLDGRPPFDGAFTRPGPVNPVHSPVVYSEKRLLPPPLTGPHETKILQRPFDPPVRPATGPWWGPAPQTAPRFTPMQPARPAGETRSPGRMPQRSVTVVQRTVGVILIVAGLVVEGLIAASHRLPEGIALGVVIVIAGVLLATIPIKSGRV
jgi:eukaryotic-like serine/threonine-protein kinase